MGMGDFHTNTKFRIHLVLCTLLDKKNKLYYTISYIICAIFLYKRIIMANLTVHIAVAQEWAKAHNIVASDDFIYGAVAPDLLSIVDKKDGNFHYGHNFNSKSLKEYYLNKVDLGYYVCCNGITTDYDLGYFLHLVTDYYFYIKFLNLNDIDKYGDNFKSMLFETYDATLPFVNNFYKVNYDNSHPQLKYVKDKYENAEVGDYKFVLYDNEKIKNFIDEIAHIDLFKLYEEISKTQVSEGVKDVR